MYAVGLGKGAIPTAAAVNWVLKDGLGYLSKILLSKFGRHFDVNPKGWRLFADLLENTAYGLEILTPVFPHLFVPIGAAAGAGRSAAALIQVRTVDFDMDCHCCCTPLPVQTIFAHFMLENANHMRKVIVFHVKSAAAYIFFVLCSTYRFGQHCSDYTSYGNMCYPNL